MYDVQNSMYPHLSKDERPQDKIAQLNSALTKLRSSASESKRQRDERIYELWTLGELMSDPYCCDEFMSHNALSIVAIFLREDNSSGKTLCSSCAATSVWSCPIAIAKLRLQGVLAEV